MEAIMTSMNAKINAAAFHSGKHLQDNQLRDSEDHCPVCLSVEMRTKVMRLQTEPEVHLLECGCCGGVSASKMPTDEALDEYYGTYYSQNKYKVTFHNIRRLAKNIYKNIQDELFLKNETVRILDYGGGNGGLAASLAELTLEKYPGKKIQIVLIDMNVEKPSSKGQIQFNSYKNIDDAAGDFQIILASAVLEHIPKLHEAVTALAKKLSTGGYFYARTPYIVPFMRIFRFIDFSFPGHVHDLGPLFWGRFQKIFFLNWTSRFSRSSIIETSFKESFFRTLTAHILKFPSRIEELLFGRVLLKPLWKYVGGWEVLLVNK